MGPCSANLFVGFEGGVGWGGGFRKIKSLSDVGRFYMKTHFTSPLTCGVLWKAWCVSGGNAKIIVEVRSGGQSAGRQH